MFTIKMNLIAMVDSGGGREGAARRFNSDSGLGCEAGESPLRAACVRLQRRGAETHTPRVMHACVCVPHVRPSCVDTGFVCKGV